MVITCWGSRGSIPVSGREYNKYGGDTTCLEIRSREGDVIIVDAGTGIRRLGNRLIEERAYRYHLIFTHAHWDHLMGFPYFKPLFLRQAAFHIHRCPFHDDFVRSMLARMLEPPNFPVKYSELAATLIYEQSCPDPFKVGSVTITPVPISHPNGGSGYRFSENGKSFVFLTDNELAFRHPGGLEASDYADFCHDADLLVHDAEYTPEEYRRYREWGHSAYTGALRLALAAGVKRLGLFHLNQDRTDTQMDAIVADCRRRAQEAGGTLDCFAVATDMTFQL